jgi:multidrug transporter EmrE-like cation transporter
MLAASGWVASPTQPAPNRSEDMNAIRLTALALIVAGALGLAYGSFSFTRETHEAQIGPLSLSVQEKETVNVPVWAGIGAIVAGAALLLLGGKPR